MTKTTKFVGIILGATGLFISIYLSYVRLTAGEYLCGISSCGIVNNSEYSTFLGIPVAYLGLIYYLGVIILYKIEKPWILLMYSLFGVLFSGYLTYLEAFVIQAWCQWCVFSAWISFALFFISLYEVLKLRRLPKEGTSTLPINSSSVN